MDQRKWYLSRQGGADFEITLHDKINIGRSTDSHVCCLHLSVSRIHCVVHNYHKLVAVEDRQTANGTFLNGKRIPPNTPILLLQNETISFGQKTIDSPPNLYTFTLTSNLSPDHNIFKTITDHKDEYLSDATLRHDCLKKFLQTNGNKRKSKETNTNSHGGEEIDPNSNAPQQNTKDRNCLHTKSKSVGQEKNALKCNPQKMADVNVASDLSNFTEGLNLNEPIGAKTPLSDIAVVNESSNKISSSCSVKKTLAITSSDTKLTSAKFGLTQNGTFSPAMASWRKDKLKEIAAKISTGDDKENQNIDQIKNGKPKICTIAAKVTKHNRGEFLSQLPESPKNSRKIQLIDVPAKYCGSRKSVPSTNRTYQRAPRARSCSSKEHENIGTSELKHKRSKSALNLNDGLDIKVEPEDKKVSSWAIKSNCLPMATHQAKYGSNALMTVKDEQCYAFLVRILKWDAALLLVNEDVDQKEFNAKTETSICYSDYQKYRQEIEDSFVSDIWKSCKSCRSKVNPHPPKSGKVTSLHFPSFGNEFLVKVGLEIEVIFDHCQFKSDIKIGDLMIASYPTKKSCIRHQYYISYIDSLKIIQYEDKVCLHLVMILIKHPSLILNIGDKLNINPIISIKNYICMMSSVSTLPQSPLCNNLLMPSKNICHLIKLSKENNEKQVENLKNLCFSTNSDALCICLIEGLGKYRAICTTIIDYLTSSNKSDRQNKKILVCAQSNSALDKFFIELLHLREKLHSENRFSMVRVGKNSAVHADVKKYELSQIVKNRLYIPSKIQSEIAVFESVIHGCEKNHDSSKFDRKLQATLIRDFTKKIEDLKRPYINYFKIEQEEKKIVECSDVIFTTLAGCSLPKIQTLNGKILCCIECDASRATEPESLAPFSLGMRKLILIGDQRQKPTQMAVDCSQKESLFSRLKKIH